jgi:hypothetical protein
MYWFELSGVAPQVGHVGKFVLKIITTCIHKPIDEHVRGITNHWHLKRSSLLSAKSMKKNYKKYTVAQPPL